MKTILPLLLVIELVATSLAGAAPIAAPSVKSVKVTASTTSIVSTTPQMATPAPEASVCVERVENLPASPLYRPNDRRLRAAHLVVVLKKQRRLMLFRHGKAAPWRASPRLAERSGALRAGRSAVTNNKARGCWHIGLGSGGPIGTKLKEGDLKTPEGWYRTSDKPWSSFYGAIAIHYPNAGDARRGLASGLINRTTYGRILHALRRGHKPPQTTALGGEVLIHGGGGSSDWTLGCVALDNNHLDELRAALPRHKRFDVLILP